jgi:tetratricopeptide (TPR) repeat protein
MRIQVVLLPVALLASCGIFGLSTEERDRIAAHTRNALTYYEGGRFNQCLDQVRRGLEIDPENYRLKTVRAWCYLRTTTGDRQGAEQTEKLFEEVYAMRSPEQHAPPVLIGYALIHQRFALRHQEQVLTLREELERAEPLERTTKEARITEHLQLARARFQKTEAALRVLVAREDELQLAHYHLMQTAGMQGRYEDAIASGTKMLEINATFQANWQQRFEQTSDAAFESWSGMQLQQLTDLEIDVRAYLANLHYKHGNHEAAVAELDQVLLKDPTRSDDYYNRARCLQRLGRTSDARRDYERFLATTRLPQGNANVTNALKAIQER